MRSRGAILFVVMLAAWAFPTAGRPAGRPLGMTVRVTLKRILPSDSRLSATWTRQRMREAVESASAILEREAGIRLRVVDAHDVVDPERPTSWWTIDTDDLYELEEAARDGAVDVGWRTDAMNVFFVESLDFRLTAGVCSYPGHDIVAVAVTKAPATTLAHEIGHYFGLFHTHEDFYGRDDLVRCMPRSPACDRVGDFICDTPPDPYDARDGGTLETLYRGCHGGARTAEGKLQRNLMSYYHADAAAARLTRGQVRRMRAYAEFRDAVLDRAASSQ